MARRSAAAPTNIRSEAWLGNIAVWTGRYAAVSRIGSRFGDDDSVLVMGGEAAVDGADGPAVAVKGDAACGGGDDGLDSDDEAFGEEMAGIGIGIVGYAGLFVNGAANAVAA